MANAIIKNIASDLRVLKIALNIIIAQIKDGSPYILDEELNDLRLIFSELLSNAIIHGNKYDICKKIHIIILFTDDNITAKITDEGDGFNHSEMLKLINEGGDFLSEKGRGIKLAMSLTDELLYKGDGNEIIFFKKFANEKLENTTSRMDSLNIYSADINEGGADNDWNPKPA